MTDIFVSHASEDKDEFVRPLAKKLKNSGINIWYDEFTLKAGDSLRRSIDKGLTECKGGLVVLSDAFFKKEWPQRELDALFTAEVNGKVRLVPIWHEISAEQVSNQSAFLADRVAINSNEDIDVIIRKILDVFPLEYLYSNGKLKDLLESYVSYNDIASNAFGTGCSYRYERMNAFRSEYQVCFSEVVDALTDEEADNLPQSDESALNKLRSELIEKYNFPKGVYLTDCEPRDEPFINGVSRTIELWASGTLSDEESSKLVTHLDLDELDERYILFDLPNYSLSRKQYDIVTAAMIAFGSGFEDGYNKYRIICDRLDE